jgi:hypothetical protein
VWRFESAHTLGAIMHVASHQVYCNMCHLCMPAWRRRLSFVYLLMCVWTCTMWCPRSSGAVQKLAEARINNELASEIASMKPVHTNMGIFDFLPFDVPFLDQVLPVFLQSSYLSF